MIALRVLCALFLASFAHCLPLSAQQTLYTQSLQTQLVRPNLELLVLDLRTRQVLANTFPAAPIPPGSLLKPFLALAYLQRPYHPELGTVCHGHPDRCWRAGGHGALTLPQALAQSCNAYFLALARTLIPDEITLPASAPPNATPETLIGLNSTWLIPPSTLAEAYAQLLTSPATPPAILEGMRLAATKGTAAALGSHPGGVLAKTGTAPCIGHPSKASGDGLVLAAVPAGHPTILLLVRRRGTTGATTAQSAGPILTQLKALHAY